MQKSIEPTDVAPTQAAYPVIEAERDMAIAQRDSARRENARLREALEWLVNLHHDNSKDSSRYYPEPSEWVDAINAGVQALAAAGKAVRDE